jgi:competence protein ComFC
MIAIHPVKIEGRWRSGFALDLHTTASVPVGPNEAGHMQFDTVRSAIGELLYQLKYRGDRAAAQAIIEAAASFLRPHRAKLDILVPVPPSAPRTLQPVLVLARGIGAAIDLPVAECVIPTRATAQLKDVTDPEKRKELVEGLYTADSARTAGKRILLFDDLFRSGTTLNAITELLMRRGRAVSVRVLTITKTRSNQ